ncbi:FolC bifunctional protein [Scenedesmus sp. NREL 46B-D3]|nr:FolC bifunctional protein [Scenedesmus sp. NREL 46B-D3]
MRQLAGLSAAVLVSDGACRHSLKQAAAAGTAAGFSSSSAAAVVDGDGAADNIKPGQAFLQSLIDYEKLGVPKAAGVSSSSSSSSSAKSFDLRVMRQLLAELGNPQQRLKVVHVAGTKGKGSVVVLLSAILRAAGLTVGTYTSPHLFDIRERVVAGGSAAAAAPVTEDDWEALAVQAQAAVQTMQQQQQQQQQDAEGDISTTSNSSSTSTRPSHFEVVTAMALQHFAQQRVDIAVVETGLGGATDATNVFGPQQLQAAVLTAIGLDHVEALGGSLRSIASAKAGIMKAGVPVVVGPQGGLGSSAAVAAAAADASDSRQLQQQGCGAGHDSGAVVWEVLRAAAGQPGMQCPVVAAEHAVQVTPVEGRGSSSSSITILDGPAPNLARQTVDIRAALDPLQEDRQQQQPQQQQQQVEGAAPGQQRGRLSLPGVRLQLVGGHQAGNVQTAVAAALLLRQRGWSGITAEALAAGLQQAWLPGRFQVAEMPGSPGCHVVLDAAHTADSAAALASTLRTAFPEQPVALVLAMAGDKQHREVCEALQCCRPSAVVFTTVAIAAGHHRAAPPGTLAAQWQAAGMLAAGRRLRCRQLIQASLGAALEKARHELRAHGGRAGVVAVTGSLHAVAAAMKQLGLGGAAG